MCCGGCEKHLRRTKKFVRRILKLIFNPRIKMEEFVHQRAGHIAFSHENRLMIWGGYRENNNSGHLYWPTDEVGVYDMYTKRWTIRKTTGRCPPLTCGATGAVFNDKLYILCGFYKFDFYDDDDGYEDTSERNSNEIWILNLFTLCWDEKPQPKGVPPLRCDKLSSWVYQEKIYIFGGFGPPCDARYAEELPASFQHHIDASSLVAGFPPRFARGWSNQLVAYNVRKDSWEWPNHSGKIPTPRAAHTTVANGCHVFLFGGRFDTQRLNDLYHLDMKSLQWRIIHDTIPRHMTTYPAGRSWHSLTLVPDDGAVLYGGYDTKQNPLDDCWFLDLNEPYSPTVMNRWTRLRHLEFGGPRLWHDGACLPNAEVFIAGGVTNDLLNRSNEVVLHPERMLSLVLTPRPLLLIALDYITSQPSVFESQIRCLPANLQKYIRERK